MIIGNELTNLLKNSNNIIAKELLRLKTDTPTWDKNIDYINIAIENPSKISYISKNRIEKFISTIHWYTIFNGTKLKFNKKGLLNRYHIPGNIWVINPCTIRMEDPLPSGELLRVTNGSNSYWYPLSNFKNIKCKFKYSYFENIDNTWNNDLRSKIAYMINPGKFIKKLELDFSDKEIQEFFNLFLTDNICLKIENSYFELIKGDAITEAYHYSNYYSNDNGTLASSCMKHDESQNWVNIYAKYPDQINMLVLRDLDSNKVKGRAIVWKCFNEKNEKITFMDRIYTNNSNHEKFFKVYAENNKWWYKKIQSYSDPSTFMTPNNGYIDYIEDYIKITLKNAVDKYFPYLDTFCTGNINDCDLTLFNNENGYYNFHNTDGGPFKEELEIEHIWSSYEDEDIPVEESVYCRFIDDRIYEHHAVIMSNGDYMPEDSDNITRIDLIWYYNDELIYSESNDEFLLPEDAFKVNGDYYKEYEVVWSKYNEEYILKTDAVKSEYHKSWLREADCIKINDDQILSDQVEEYKLAFNLVEEEVIEI